MRHGTGPILMPIFVDADTVDSVLTFQTATNVERPTSRGEEKNQPTILVLSSHTERGVPTQE